MPGCRTGVVAAILVAVAAAGEAAAQPFSLPDEAGVEPAAERLAWETPQDRTTPLRRLSLPALEDRGFETFGWIETGIGANQWGSTFNGPITFNDRNWQGQLNQLYTVVERRTDAAAGRHWGGRADLLFGTDFFYTTARGLDASSVQRHGIENVATWDVTKDYGFALPQLYGEVAAGDWSLRFGHFYALVGFESVPAVANFFYTHSYSMQNEPFTYTGFQASWQATDGVTLYGGLHDGWNNFSDPQPMLGGWSIRNPDYPGAGSTAAFFGGVLFASDDESQTLFITTTTGNEVTVLGTTPAAGTLVGNRSLISTVYTNRLTRRLTYVFQNDNAWQFQSATQPGNIGQPAGLAQWYSFNQYLLWRFNDRWLGGMRLEYFRDNNGYTVTAPLRNEAQASNPGFYRAGFAGNFWELTLGLNYQPSRDWMIRPELRYDWFTPNAASTPRPFGRGIGEGIGTAGNRLDQLYAGCDVIFQY